VGYVAASVVWLAYVPQDPTPQEVILYANLINVANLLGVIAGLGMVLGPMRARNGYRGGHEWISGTRTIRLPPLPRRRVFVARPPDQGLLPAVGLPERLGPFAIRGAFSEGAERVLLGQDAALGRAVWIWVRPASESPLAPSRRDLGRAGRLRWLAGGHEGDLQWDAFLAPPGAPLSDLSASEGRLPWVDVRPLLEQLTDELVAACGDGTLPERLTVEQVWVQPSGNVQLLDFSLGGSEAKAASQPAADHRRALNLVHQVAAWALQGEPPATDDAAVSARIPEHARRLLERLTTARGGYRTVKQFQATLQATSDRPVEVTRLRRAGQIAIWLALGMLGPCSCMIGGALAPMFSSLNLFGQIKEGEHAREELERGASLDFVTTRLNPQPLVGVKAALQLQQDLALRDQLDETLLSYRQQREAQLQSSSRFVGRRFLAVMEYSTEQQLPAMRQQAQQRRGGEAVNFRQQAAYRTYRDFHEGAITFLVAAVMLAVWPIVWVVWAFLCRGGLSYRLSGLALVGADGLPAARWRCAARQFLVWMPVLSLLLLSTWAETRYWSEWWQPDAAWLPWCSWLAWWAAVALLAGYTALALWHPGRSLHDRLAGVWLVPR